jgi:hypothetical protein
MVASFNGTFKEYDATNVILSPCRLEDTFEKISVMGNSSGTFTLRLFMYWDSFDLFQLSPKAGN